MNKTNPIGWTNAIRVYWAQWRVWKGRHYQGTSGYIAVSTDTDKADPYGYAQGQDRGRSDWVIATGYDGRLDNRDHKRFRFGVPKVTKLTETLADIV